MSETATRVAGLDTEELTALHARLDAGDPLDPAQVEAHHLVTVEMLKRGLEHGHGDDSWASAAVLVESVEVDSPDDVEAPEGMEKAFSEALASGGTLSVLLTVDGYVLKADPTVSDVHVDTIMSTPKRRKFKPPITEVEKTVVEEDGKWTVYSEDRSRKFGTYTTEAEATARLAQIERFKKADWKVGDFASWNSSGGMARGQIEHIMREGVLGIPDSDFSVRAEEGDPAVLLRIFRRGPEGWAATETLVGHKSSTLRPIEDLVKKEAGYAVPEDVQAAARTALRWIADGRAGDGFTSVGRNRAKQLAAGGSVSRSVLVKMRAYFARHIVDKEAKGWGDRSNPTPGMVAWYAWGGDAGRAWANRVLEPVEKRAVPEPIRDIHLNLENRQHAIDEYLYGPMNPDEPGDYWQRLGDVWGVDAEEAATTRCSNCAAFNVKPEILDAIAENISEEGDDVVEAADLGYCELFQFKCAGARSCTAWLTGGPIGREEEDDDEDEIELLESMDEEDLAEFASYAYLEDEMDDMEKRGNPEALRDYWRGGGKGKISWGAGGDFTSCVAAVGKYMTSEQAKGYCAIRHREVTGMWPGDKRNRTKKAREAIAKFTLPGGATYEFSVPLDEVGSLEPMLKHPGHADQKVHAGRSTSVSPDVASSIVERVRANGGLSVNMLDGSEPPSGYMVARGSTRGVKPAIVDAEEFYDPVRGPAALSSFMKDNRATLTRGDYLGLWHDQESGKVFLDVSENVKDRGRAERLGRRRDQISIWDVANMKEISTGGTGEISKAEAATGAPTAGSVDDDGRGDRRLRAGDLDEVHSDFLKHGSHDQQSHAGGRGGARTAKPAKLALNRPGMGDGVSVSDEEFAELKATSAGKHIIGRNVDGSPVFTPERQALHDRIVLDAVDGVPKSSDPTYHMLGGGPAAGKTTMEKEVVGDYKGKAVGVNADGVKERLPEYEQMVKAGDAGAAAFTHEESSYVAKRMQKAAFERGQDIVLDGTGDSSAESLQGKIDKARAKGYKVKGYYATVPTAEAVRRAKERGERTGRKVPESVIRNTHKSVSRVFPTAVRGFDEVKLFDTSSGARLIAEATGGRLTVLDRAAYDEFIAKGDE